VWVRDSSTSVKAFPSAASPTNSVNHCGGATDDYNHKDKGAVK